MRSTYAPKETYTGTGLLDEYTFDFKIEALAQLLVIELDDTGVETQRVRGTDVTYISSVEFDAINGGGTVTLAANLTSGYTLILLLANDAPTQPYRFTDKGDFSLKLLERALDYVLGPIQRLTYRANQALRIDDAEDETAVDTRFIGDTSNLLADNAEKYLRVNDDGDGFVYGLTLAEFQAAIFPTASNTNDVAYWNGAAWVAGLRGGGMLVSATQSIASGGDIEVNGSIQQLLKVQGDSGPQTASVSPFTGTLFDGMIITLLGMSDVNVLKIPYTDGVDGCILKGDRYLGAGDTLTLVYDSATRRFYELARNE